MKLPSLPMGDKIRQRAQTAFGGLNHTFGAADEELYDMRNLWSGDAPLLSVRPGRVTLGSLTKPNGLFHADHRITVDGTTIYVDGVSAGTVADSRKVFAALGERILIWPDKKVLIPPVAPATTWTLDSLESSVTVSATFTDGTYAGETAEGNTIKAADASFDWATYFNVGDAVTISGAADAENNITIIVREVDGDELRFYENSFTDNSTAASITVSRTVPDLDWICTNENRVWGCKGDTICCSKLGDPYNWNVFDGISTDAWSWDTGTEGSFTGCISYMGYPCFFKERHIFKVYGDKPTNFEPMGSPDLGVMSGCGRSLAIANETLFYLSRVGPMAYAGGVPRPIGEVIGATLTEGVGGSDGLRYFLSAKSGTAWLLYVYDALRQMWHIEDATHAVEFAPGSAGSVECLTSGGALWTTDEAATGTAEAAFQWSAELGDYYTYAATGRTSRYSPNKKHITKILIRLDLPTNATATVSIRYDSTGDWITAASLTAGVKRSEYIAIIPRRCDHFRLKLAGTGRAKVYSITTETAEGSPNKL